MEDQSIFNSQPKGGISEDFRQFIKELVEEVGLERSTFDEQKRWLRRLGETEGVDCDVLEKNLTDFFEAMQEWRRTKSKLGERMVRMLGKECYLTEQDIDGLLQGQQGGTDDEYISECIKEVCIKGDSISKYRTIIEKKYGIEYYQKCEGFVEEMKRSVDKKKFTNTSVTNLHYLAHQIGVSEATVDAIVKQFADKFENGHEYIDLGLPSGTLWATCNIGATKPEDYGEHFAWGEIGTKHIYDESTYKYANGGSFSRLTKYCSKSKYGNHRFSDRLTELQYGDDPASSWGDGWHMPTKAQCDELLSYTTNQWAAQNGVEGRLFTSKQNGQMLFLPAAGSRWDSGLYNAGSFGNYWTRSLYIDNPDSAWYLRFFSGNCNMGCYIRGRGFSVRPVRQK